MNKEIEFNFRAYYIIIIKNIFINIAEIINTSIKRFIHNVLLDICCNGFIFFKIKAWCIFKRHFSFD